MKVVDLDYKEYRKGNIKGEVIIDPAETGEATTASQKQMEQMTYDLIIDMQGKEGTIDCKLATDAITYGTIHFVTSNEDVAIHDMPSSSIEMGPNNPTFFDQYMATANPEQLFINLENAGVPLEELLAPLMMQ